MVKPQYSVDLRNTIKEMHLRGVSVRKISKQTGIPKSSVGDIIKRFKQRGSVVDAERPGRPPVLSEREKRDLVIKSKQNPRMSAPMQQVGLNSTRPDHPVSISSVKVALIEGGQHGRRPVRKPLISTKNRRARIKFAREHLHWTSRQWNSVVWSDESKFELFSDGVQFVRRPVNERYNPKFMVPTVKHGGGSVMVWGCFIGGTIGPLHLIDGIMRKEQYVDILERTMLPWASVNCPAGWKFQQDNDPKHTSGYATLFFNQKKIKVLKWPSQSPDLNPIEHLWEVLDRAVRGRNPKNTAEKFKILQEAWEQIPSNTLTNLVESMPQRCAAVLKAKGFPTRY